MKPTDSRSVPPWREATFKFPATFAAVSAVGEAIRAFRSQTPGASEVNIDLGVVEALNNIVEHGYDVGAAGKIELRYREYADHLVVEIVDGGRAVPLERLGEADGRVFDFDDRDVANLPEGGMGLALIKALFDGVHYSSRGGENCLRLTKTMSSPD